MDFNKTFPHLVADANELEANIGCYAYTFKYRPEDETLPHDEQMRGKWVPTDEKIWMIIGGTQLDYKGDIIYRCYFVDENGEVGEDAVSQFGTPRSPDEITIVGRVWGV